MSYVIEYDPHKKGRYPTTARNYRKFPFLMLSVILFLSLYFVQKWDVAGIRSLWYSVLETFADNVKEGTEIGESIAQCISMLNG